MFALIPTMLPCNTTIAEFAADINKLAAVKLACHATVSATTAALTAGNALLIAAI